MSWTNSHQYLLVWVDKRLSFTAQVAYFRERTQARLNTMRAMTRHIAGAMHSVLRLFHVEAVRKVQSW